MRRGARLDVRRAILLAGLALGASTRSIPTGATSPSQLLPYPGQQPASGADRPSSPAAQPGNRTALAGSASAAPETGAESDIREIRGPKYLRPAWLPFVIIAAATLSALAVFALWRWLRRPRAPRAKTAVEAALAALEDIRALMQPPRAREFSIAVSDVVRIYIERRFNVTATQRTTEEFLRDALHSSAALAGHRAALAAFLERCDLAKFAGMSLSLASMQALHDAARSFVQATAKTEEARDPLPAT